MDPVQFNCPHCSGLFQIDPAMAGGQVSCPMCQRIVAIPEFSAPPRSEPPAPSDPPAPSEPPAQDVQLSCPWCTGVFLVTPEMAGQPVGCPHCNRQVTIPNEIAAHGAPVPPSVDGKSPRQSSAVDPDSIAQVPPVSQAASSAGRNRDAPAKLESAADAADSNLYPPGFASGADESTDRSRSTPGSPSASPAPMSEPRHATKTPRQAARAPVVSNVEPTLLPTDGTANRPAKETSRADLRLPSKTSATSSDAGGQQRASSESNDRGPVKAAKDIVIPTEDGGLVRLHDPERVVGEGARKVRLHSLTSEERTRKRSMKSLIAWLLSVLVLIGAMIVLLKK